MSTTRTPEQLIIEQLQASKNSTKDMLAVLADSKDIGDKTLKQLKSQGKQITNTQHNIDEILYQEKFAKRRVYSIKNIFMDLLYKIIPLPAFKNHNDAMDAKIAKQNKKKKPAKPAPKAKQVDNVVALAMKKTPYEADYIESEDMLDEVGKDVDDLNVIAKEMGKELGEQNQRLDVLKETTEKSDLLMRYLRDSLPR